MDLNTNLASLLTLIAAITAACVSIINAFRSTVSRQEVKAKLEEIHVSTNGNLSELKKEIEHLKTKAITDTENIRAMQDIVKSLTTGSSVNIVKSTDKK